jgi:hypothetical protein
MSILRRFGYWFLAGIGLGYVFCNRSGHIRGEPEFRWPELGKYGLIRQCPRCLYIERAET